MTRNLTATTDVRLRPAVIATLITLTFLSGIGAGLGFARVAAGPIGPDAAVRAFVESGTDMSATAYGVAHQAAIDARAGSGTDMSAAAYAAAHQAAIDARSGDDMSASAYAAAHEAALDAQAD